MKNTVSWLLTFAFIFLFSDVSSKLVTPVKRIQVATQNPGVVLEYETKISDYGLYFDGSKVDGDDRLAKPNRTDGKYDYAFGRVITPHGDCIAHYGDYVFVTWYRGGKTDRHVMLTRMNTVSRSQVTIEFPHRHTGFQNRWHIGESHNTIAVGVCPKDETVHLLYDMHAYSPSRPSDGSLSNDYFRYSVSKKNAAILPDDEFTLDAFFPKRLYLKSGENYHGLTYPDFFVNTFGDLLVKMRVGGDSNGKYQMAKYDGESWSGWTDYNVLDAASHPSMQYNWGLYGSIQYLHGKFQIGYAVRKNLSNDKYVNNNGFFYSFSTDPDGSKNWFNYMGQSVNSPITDPYDVFISEPGDEVPGAGANSVTMSSGPTWTVTERGDIHFMVNSIRGGGKNVNVHTYKKSTDSVFTTKTSFPGGDELRSVGNDIYLIGLNNGRPIIRKAEGGTNDWTIIYQATSGKTFRHGSVLIKDGKVYYYLMGNGSGNAQPLYLQIFDLNIMPIDPNVPDVSITYPSNGSIFQYNVTIEVLADAVSPEDSITKVVFFVNNNLHSQIDTYPYLTSIAPNEPGNYILLAKAYDDKGRSSNSSPVMVTVATPQLPQLVVNTTADVGIVIKTPDKKYYNIGEEVVLTAEANTGFRFSSWTGDITSEENPLTINMDSTIFLTAIFTPVYTVAISENTVNGTVSVSPEKAYYTAGETITFTPHPAPGYRFGSWYAEGGIGGNAVPLVITINRDIELTAYFDLITYQLVASAKNGTISRNPHRVVYTAGTQVDLTAAPNEGYYFTGWSGYISSEVNPITITMDSTIYITANFDLASNIEQKYEIPFKVFPNPSKGIFNIENDQCANYALYNLSGVRLKEGVVSGRFQLDMKEYPAAMYLLKINTQDGVWIKHMLRY